MTATLNKRTALIILLAAKEENRLPDGSVNWNFVSADLHIDHPEVVEGVSPEEEDGWFGEVEELLKGDSV